MPNLSNRDHMHVRHARQALDMIVNGAIRCLETDYGPNDNSDRKPIIKELIEQLKEELDDWIERSDDWNYE